MSCGILTEQSMRRESVVPFLPSLPLPSPSPPPPPPLLFPPLLFPPPPPPPPSPPSPEIESRKK